MFSRCLVGSGPDHGRKWIYQTQIYSSIYQVDVGLLNRLSIVTMRTAEINVIVIQKLKS